LQRETQWFIGKVFSTAKDERVIRPLMRAMKAPQNSTHTCNFLWPLESYGCIKHLSFFVDTFLKHNDAGEAVWACIEIIRAMKGPFEPSVARKNIRKLLAETTFPISETH